MNNYSFLCGAISVGVAGSTFAQCQPAWDYTVGNPGPGLTFGYVAPIFPWNDGSGERIFVGASDQPLLNRYDPTNNTWSPLSISTGFTNGFLTSMAVFNPGSGDRLVVGGFYDTAGTTPNTASLAMWNGSTWEAMGTNWTGSTRGSVWSLAVWNGRLYVGGGIVNQPPLIAGQPWGGIASWDGQAWTTHGTIAAPANPTAFAMQVFDAGSGESLYVGGRFSSIAGVAAPNVARFDGTNWHDVGGGLPSSNPNFGVEGMTLHAGDLYAAGFSMTPAGQPAGNVFKWDGTSWTTVGQPIGGRVTSLASFDDGSGSTLFAGRTAAFGVSDLYKLVGSTWEMVPGQLDGSVFGLTPIGDRLYVGGSFTTVGGQASNRIVSRTSCAGGCYPDCDGDAVLTLADFGCFQTKFALGDLYADCNGDSLLNLADFGCFQTEFAVGCP